MTGPAESNHKPEHSDRAVSGPIASAPDVFHTLADLLAYAERNECSHEETHRGGAIWTICSCCGKKWADDRGGFVPYVEPKQITAARAALASQTGGGQP